MSEYIGICKKAQDKCKEALRIGQEEQNRRSFIKNGICPDCGDLMHVEDHDWSGKFWKSFFTCNNGYYIHSCSKCGISKRFEYAI